MALAGVVKISAPSQRFVEAHFVKEHDSPFLKGIPMTDLPLKLWTDDTGQDTVEYAVMLAMILVLAVGTISQVREQFTFRLLMGREACSSHNGRVHGTQREECMLVSRRSFLRTQQCRDGMRAST
jgi:Flp pilus assembly pilin Flp